VRSGDRTAISTAGLAVRSWISEALPGTIIATFFAATPLSLTLAALLERMDIDSSPTPLLPSTWIILAAGPAIETLMLWALVTLLRRAGIAARMPLAMACGLTFGLMHLGNSSHAPFVSGWNFAIWAIALDHWRPRSVARGLLAAWIPHVAHNTLVLTLAGMLG
jgi:hypothetical protein